MHLKILFQNNTQKIIPANQTEEETEKHNIKTSKKLIQKSIKKYMIESTTEKIKKQSKNITITIIIISIMTAVITTLIKPQQTESPPDHQPYLKIRDAVIKVEIAKTEKEKQRGLSYRQSLDQNTGMLFIFDKPSQYTFWMHEMNFPLDFIWIHDKKVVDITENVPEPKKTSGEPITITPQVPATHILEVNAGWVKKNNIAIGDYVQYFNL